MPRRTFKTVSIPPNGLQLAVIRHRLLFSRMSNETEAAVRVTATSATTTIVAEGVVIVGDEGRRLLNDSLRSLPSDAVKDLLSVGVCERCILRLLGLQAYDSAFASVSTSSLRTLLVAGNDTSGALEFSLSSICIICLGILQFTYFDDKQAPVKKESGGDFVARIAELVKQEGHEFDGFALEVSVPSDISENEHRVWSYLKGKYGSEVWLREISPSERVSVKDALKSLISDPLGSLLDSNSGSSTFRIRLTYNRTSNQVQSTAGIKPECKRRKTENGSNFMIRNPLVAENERSDNKTNKKNESNGSISDDSIDFESFKCNVLSLEKVHEPCSLAVFSYRTPIYFGGRYLKYSRNVSQTQWIIDDERMGEASVEEIIGGNILPACLGDTYKFHAAGREDIDVRMLGSGRPFLVEIQNPRQIPSEALLKEIEAKINSLENKLVGVKNLKFVGSQGWTLMREGEAEKQKQYAALVWISRPLEDEDLNSISSLKEMKILQRTPIRVLHRRSPLDREKTIHWMRIGKIQGSCQYFLLHLCTQAGTYIKEFVHGDLGRTSPSIGSILGCRAEIVQLDVTDVKMDCFLEE